MKKLLTGAATAIALALSAPAFAASHADSSVKLQLQWVTQAQFAGYYVALEKGYYEEEGLDVTIKPGGPDIAPVQVLLGGGADVMVDWLPSALAAREKGAVRGDVAQDDPLSSGGEHYVMLPHDVTAPDRGETDIALLPRAGDPIAAPV